MKLITEHPLAADSPDHMYPAGTRIDNSKNPYFNDALIELFEQKPSVLDFGCAGGGMVEDFVKMGCLAIGLEGSTYSQHRSRAAWGTIPDNLFVVDIGFPFTLTKRVNKYGSGKPFKFDVVTMWEFVEHIPEDRIPTMILNAVRHLKPGGLVIGSTTDSQHMKVSDGRFIHQTSKPLGWWYEQFEAHGLKRDNELEGYFAKRNAWVRQVKWNFVLRLVQDGDN